ncbi:MAG: hypothetical protein ACXVY5_01515 [Gaiellales bacterium]
MAAVDEVIDAKGLVLEAHLRLSEVIARLEIESEFAPDDLTTLRQVHVSVEHAHGHLVRAYNEMQPG